VKDDQASPCSSTVLVGQSQAQEERAMGNKGRQRAGAPGSGGLGQLPLVLVGGHG
jgi:hypothetical protein